jgi:hypothetical protein
MRRASSGSGRWRRRSANLCWIYIQAEAQAAGTPGVVHRRAVLCFLFLSLNFPFFPQFFSLFSFLPTRRSVFFT